MATYCTEGIILRHQDFRETDRLLTIYTKEHGVIKVVAKASRKITSKLGGNLEPFIQANLVIAQGRHFDTIAQVEPLSNFRQLKNNLEALQLASYLAGIVDRSTRGRQRDVRIFELLRLILTVLEERTFENRKIQLVRWYFLWRYLSYLGYQPELYHCLVCKQKIAPTANYFNLRKGGLVDRMCRTTGRETTGVTADAIKVLRLIFERSVNGVVRIRVPTQLRRELEALTTAYVNYTQEQELVRR